MDKALVSVFDTITRLYNENKFAVEGWKTNSHYMINKKFIIDSIVSIGFSDSAYMSTSNFHNFEIIEDLQKALCYLTAKNYDDYMSLSNFITDRFKLFTDNKSYSFYRENELDETIKQLNQTKTQYTVTRERPFFGIWYDWGFFEVKGFKKGTMHFKFKSEKVWELFNRKVASIKGYPLPEKL